MLRLGHCLEFTKIVSRSRAATIVNKRKWLVRKQSAPGLREAFALQQICSF